MRIENTIPMVRARCEDCDWALRRDYPMEWSELVAIARKRAIDHARGHHHRVFVEKQTGSLYIGPGA